MKTLTITTRPDCSDLADLHSLPPCCDPFAQNHRPAQSFRLLLFLLHCCRHHLNLPIFLTFNLCQHELILFIVFLHPNFFFFVPSRLQGDHGPEGKMHGLSHRDVRFRTAGGWDHRSGSGGQVSKKSTGLSPEKKSFQQSSKTNEEY